MQHFVGEKQALLYSAEINEFDRWAPVIQTQRSVVGRVAKGCQATLGYLENRGITPANVQSGHPAPRLLVEYADIAGTSALTQTAAARLQHADATLAKLGVQAAAYEAKQANEEVQQVKAATKSDPRSAPPQLASLSGDAAYLDEKAAGMQRLDTLGVAPTPAQMQLLEASMKQQGFLFRSSDPAMHRRLAMHIVLPLPNEAERAELWHHMLQAGSAPLAADIDVADLTRRFPDMSGANIRNALLNALYLAASEGGDMQHAHLVRGGKAEYRAMGKVATSPRPLQEN